MGCQNFPAKRTIKKCKGIVVITVATRKPMESAKVHLMRRPFGGTTRGRSGGSPWRIALSSDSGGRAEGGGSPSRIASPYESGNVKVQPSKHVAQCSVAPYSERHKERHRAKHGRVNGGPPPCPPPLLPPGSGTDVVAAGGGVIAQDERE
jgi:hypothetical protein